MNGIDIMWRIALLAFGLGIGMSPLTNAATSSVPIKEVGIASSVLALARNIAGAFGVAIFATILTNSATSAILDVQKFSIINTFDPKVLQQVGFLMAMKANLVSFHTVFICSAAITLVGAFSALLLRETTKDMGGKTKTPSEGMI